MAGANEMKLNEKINEQDDYVYKYINPYRLSSNNTKTSKNQLKKCEKGIHEFIKTNFTEKNIKKWSCRNCGVFMDNR